MLKFQYKNATVYITKPKEQHLKNIRKATEVFLTRVVKEQNQNGDRRYCRRVSLSNPGARKRDQRIEA